MTGGFHPCDGLGGVVLCGGASARMGSPKEWLEWNGETLLARVIRIVSTVAAPVIAASRAGVELPPLPRDVRRVNDAPGYEGPLAGLLAGMEALSASRRAVFVTACDHPLLRPAFIRALAARLGDHPGVVPVLDGQTYPLTAVYRLETLPLLREWMDRGERSAKGFAARCGALRVDARELAAVDAEWESLRNVNDRQAYERLARPRKDEGPA
jgi:molybdopterin-guanine dinucleotide biosynthesis protein A